MEEQNVKLSEINLATKIWNWNMDDECATSCGNFLVAHMHALNGFTLIAFIIVCYIATIIVNYIEFKGFKTTTETLLFTSAIVYAIWNCFFGLPLKHLEIKSDNDVTFSYSTYAMTHLTAIIIAVILLFTNNYLLQ